MPVKNPIDCIISYGVSDLSKKLQQKIEEGANPYEAARELIVAEHRRIHETANEIRLIGKQKKIPYTEPKDISQQLKKLKEKPSVSVQMPGEVKKPEVVEPKTSGLKIGDSVQWTSQGVDQFDAPRKITSISDDGKYAFVEGTNTGIPIEQLSPQPAETATPTAPQAEAAETMQQEAGEPSGEKLTAEPPPGEPPPGEPPPTDTGKTDGGETGGKKKSTLNRLYEAKNMPERAKEAFEKEGFEYVPSSQEEAAAIAKVTVDELGIDAAVKEAAAGTFNGGVNAMIFGEALNRLADNENDAGKWAEVAIQWDKYNRVRGQDIAGINFFYKHSPLGVILKENADRKKQFDEWAKGKNQSWKEYFEELKKDPEFAAVVSGKVQEQLKTERQTSRAKRLASVRSAFAKAKDKFKKEGGGTYSIIIPPHILETALEAMELAYEAGEAVTKIIEDAVKLISDKIGTTAWDKDKFKKEWEEKLGEDVKKEYKINREKRIEYLKGELERISKRKQKDKKETGGKREISAEEQILLDEIEAEQTKWDDEIDAARQLAKDYQKMETERNRQLRRVDELNDKIETLRGGKLPETQPKTPKKDTPEIEALKTEKAKLEKQVRESIAQENKMKDLESELQRLKDRKKKESKTESKKIITEAERQLRDEIEAERKAWGIENNIQRLRDELQRVKNRQKKESDPKQKRELTGIEKRLTEEIKKEKTLWAKEIEPAKKVIAALKAAQKSLDEYERRIKEKDISSKDSGTPETPELKALREKRDAKRKEYAAMKKEMTKRTEAEVEAKNKQRILERFRKRLKGLTEKQKEDVIRKSHKKLIENGGLDYDEFKEIIGRVTGRGELTDEQRKQLKDMVEKTNAAGEAAKVAQQERTPESLEKFYAAEIEAGRAARDLRDIFRQKPDIIRRLTSIMQLSTLGAVSLVANVTYNIWNQLALRYPIGLINDTIDRIWGGIGRMMGKPSVQEYNVWEAQGAFWNKMGQGVKQSFEQIGSGLNRQDYTQKELYGQQMRPFKAWRELMAYAKGKRPLTRAEWWDKLIEGTAGIPAELVARFLNVGDKPLRFGAQGAQAKAFTKALGLKDIDEKLFIEFPREEAYRYYKGQGLSDEVAQQKADYIGEAILKEGARATLQQDNLLSDMINAAFGKLPGGKDSGVAALTKTLAISPYIKIPTNVFWSYYNLINPEVGILQALTYAGLSKKAKAKGDITKAQLLNREARYWMAHAMVGMAMRAVVIAMVQAGMVTPPPDEEDSKKERESIFYFDKPGTIQIGDQKIQSKWFGPLGMLAMPIARKYYDATPEQRENQDEFWNIVYGGMERDALSELENGIFANTSSLFQSISSGDFSRYGINTLNLFANIIQPATIAQLNRAALDEVPTSKGDSFLDRLNQNFAQRSTLYRRIFDVELYKKQDIFGRPIPKGGNLLSRMFGVSKANPQLEMRLLYDDYLRTGDSGFLPSATPTKIGDTKLTMQQQQKLAEYVGEERLRKLRPYISGAAKIPIIEKPYSDLTDEKKKEVVQSIYESGRQKGVEKFYKEYPEFKKPELSPEEQAEKKLLDVGKKLINQ